MTNRSGYEQISSVGSVWLAASFCTMSCIGVAIVAMPDVAGTRDYATMKSLVYSGAIMRRFGPVFRSVQDFLDINVTVTKI